MKRPYRENESTQKRVKLGDADNIENLKLRLIEAVKNGSIPFFDMRIGHLEDEDVKDVYSRLTDLAASKYLAKGVLANILKVVGDPQRVEEPPTVPEPLPVVRNLGPSVTKEDVKRMARNGEAPRFKKQFSELEEYQRDLTIRDLAADFIKSDASTKGGVLRTMQDNGMLPQYKKEIKKFNKIANSGEKPKPETPDDNSYLRASYLFLLNAVVHHPNREETDNKFKEVLNSVSLGRASERGFRRVCANLIAHYIQGGSVSLAMRMTRFNFFEYLDESGFASTLTREDFMNAKSTYVGHIVGERIGQADAVAKHSADSVIVHFMNTRQEGAKSKLSKPQEAYVYMCGMNMWPINASKDNVRTVKLPSVKLQGDWVVNFAKYGEYTKYQGTYLEVGAKRLADKVSVELEIGIDDGFFPSWNPSSLGMGWYAKAKIAKSRPSGERIHRGDQEYD